MKYILIISLILLNVKSHSQTVLDYFLIVPDSVSVFNKIDRGKMSDNYKKGLNEYYFEKEFKYWFEVVDIKNGYLRVDGAFEGTWEICYWNKNDGNKLIGISSVTCGPVCGSRVTFYDYSKGNLTALNVDSILPPISYADYYDIPKIQENNSPQDFVKLKEEFSVAWTCRLPQKGLNMTVNFELIDGIDTKKYKIYYKSNTDKMELLWNKGKFKKGHYIK